MLVFNRHKKLIIGAGFGAFGLSIIHFLQRLLDAPDSGLLKFHIVIPHILTVHLIIPIMMMGILLLIQRLPFTKKHLLKHLIIALISSALCTIWIALIDLVFQFYGNWNILPRLLSYHFTHYYNFCLMAYGFLFFISYQYFNHQSANSKFSFEKIPIRERNRILLLDQSEIIWIQAADNYVKIYTGEKFYMERMPLKEVIDRLNSNLFKQVHRSSIVNLNHINSIESNGTSSKTIHLNGNYKTKLSKMYRGNLMAWQ